MKFWVRKGLSVKLGLMFVGLFLLAGLAAMAVPDNRFNGGDCDGYEVCSTNNFAIPPVPNKGTVVIIL